MSAWFDSAMRTAPPPAPSTVQLEPVEGAIVLSAEAVAEIRKLGLNDGVAGALLLAGIEETGADSETDFFFDAVSLPESGSLTLSTDDGFAEPFRANAAGTFTYVAGDLELFIASEDEESVMFAGLSCIPDEGQDLTIDQIVAVGATTPTPTPSAPGRFVPTWSRPTPRSRRRPPGCPCRRRRRFGPLGRCRLTACRSCRSSPLRDAARLVRWRPSL